MITIGFCCMRWGHGLESINKVCFKYKERLAYRKGHFFRLEIVMEEQILCIGIELFVFPDYFILRQVET